MSILTVLILVAVFLYYGTVQNVFDEMYFSWDKSWLVKTRFDNVPALLQSLHRKDPYVYPGDVKETDVLNLSFDDSFLKDHTSVYISIDPKYKKLYATCYVYFDGSETWESALGEALVFGFSYHESKKTFTIAPIEATSEKLIQKFPDKYEGYEYYSDNHYMELFMKDHAVGYEDIEQYKDYFINKVLIRMWLDGNRKDTRFTEKYIGNLKIDDKLFDNLKVE